MRSGRIIKVATLPTSSPSTAGARRVRSPIRATESAPSCLALHVPDGATIADVTFGQGVFWRDVAKNRNLRLRYSNRRADRPAFLDLSHLRR